MTCEIEAQHSITRQETPRFTNIKEPLTSWISNDQRLSLEDIALVRI